jgi:hypothetical protein
LRGTIFKGGSCHPKNAFLGTGDDITRPYKWPPFPGTGGGVTFLYMPFLEADDGVTRP